MYSVKTFCAFMSDLGFDVLYVSCRSISQHQLEFFAGCGCDFCANRIERNFNNLLLSSPQQGRGAQWQRTLRKGRWLGWGEGRKEIGRGGRWWSSILGVLIDTEWLLSRKRVTHADLRVEHLTHTQTHSRMCSVFLSHTHVCHTLSLILHLTRMHMSTL